MTIVPVAPPHTVAIFSGFDYVAVDAQRGRVYAAHTASRALTVVDARTGAVLGQVRVGPLHGVAVDPVTGHVFTGNGDADSVSEVDPVAMKVLRTADVGGSVDAIAYDPANGHIYADEDDGTHIYVVDAKTMKSAGTVDLPGHKPEYLAIDPKSHDVYQNISNLNEVAVVDPTTLKVKSVIPTPEIVGNHPLQIDGASGRLIVGGQNGTIATYDLSGKFVGSAQVQERVDQCSFGERSRRLACAGSGEISVVAIDDAGMPALVSRAPIDKGAHTLAIDDATGDIWTVWASAQGDFVQAFRVAP